jgi:hypothetical protein
LKRKKIFVIRLLKRMANISKKDKKIPQAPCCHRHCYHGAATAARHHGIATATRHHHATATTTTLLQPDPTVAEEGRPPPDPDVAERREGLWPEVERREGRQPVERREEWLAPCLALPRSLLPNVDATTTTTTPRHCHLWKEIVSERERERDLLEAPGGVANTGRGHSHWHRHRGR